MRQSCAKVLRTIVELWTIGISEPMKRAKPVHSSLFVSRNVFQSRAHGFNWTLIAAYASFVKLGLLFTALCASTSL